MKPKTIDELIAEINPDIAINIERCVDQYGNLYFRVTDKTNTEFWNYEGRGYALEKAIRDYISDLSKYENKAKYSNRNRTKQQIQAEIDES